CLPKVPGKKNSKGKAANLRSVIEADIGDTFPHVHSRVRTLLSNVTFKKLSQVPAAKGALKGWVAILLNRQSRPSSTRPIPIPFDRQHSKVLPGATANDDASLFVRLHRDETATRKVAEFEEFKLRTTGRASRYVKPITRLATGEWEFK